MGGHDTYAWWAVYICLVFSTLVPNKLCARAISLSLSLSLSFHLGFLPRLALTPPPLRSSMLSYVPLFTPLAASCPALVNLHVLFILASMCTTIHPPRASSLTGPIRQFRTFVPSTFISHLSRG